MKDFPGGFCEQRERKQHVGEEGTLLLGERQAVCCSEIILKFYT